MSWPSSTVKVNVVSAINQSKSLNRIATRSRHAATLSTSHCAKDVQASTRSSASLRAARWTSPGWLQPIQNPMTHAASGDTICNVFMSRCGQIQRMARGPWDDHPIVVLVVLEQRRHDSRQSQGRSVEGVDELVLAVFVFEPAFQAVGLERLKVGHRSSPPTTVPGLLTKLQSRTSLHS